MKQFFLCLTLFIFFGIGYSNAQTKSVEVILKSGDTLKGIGKLKETFVKYKKQKKSESKKIEFSKIRYMTTTWRKGYKQTHRFLREKNRGEILPLQEVVKGKVSLYLTSTKVIGQNGIAQVFRDYYVKRVNEKEVTHIMSTALISGKFRKTTKKYFSDCPKLVDAIESRKFRKKDIVTVVKLYNKGCK
jgi:hypothetical protein